MRTLRRFLSFGLSTPVFLLLSFFSPESAAQDANYSTYYCGDGTCHVDFESPETCSLDCGGPTSVCGNGIVEGDEQCDDANEDPFDGCSFCHVVSLSQPFCSCGNGITENSLTMPECGGTTTDGVPMSELVGESYRWPEECDPGYGSPDALRCTDECLLCALEGETIVTISNFSGVPRECCVGLLPDGRNVCGGGCGNGVTDEGEECDDGNTNHDDLCRNDCLFQDSDRELCFIPDGGEFPPGTRVRVEADFRFISRCETGNSVRYVVCGEAGIFTVGINVCEMGVLCEEGACFEASTPACTDTDGDDPSTRGGVWGTARDGDAYARYDYCWDDGSHVSERLCLGGEAAGGGRECDPGEVCRSEPVTDPVDGEGTVFIGACVPGAVDSTCTDTDGDDRQTRGGVWGTERDGDAYARYDYCRYDGNLVNEMFCDGGVRAMGTRPCDPGDVCRMEAITDPVDGEGTVLVGACVPGAVDSTCTDTDGDDPQTRGGVWGMERDGDAYVTYDSCLIDGNYVTELSCVGGDGLGVTRGCGEGEVCRTESVADPVDGVGTVSIGACVSGCPCSREPPAATAGFVTGVDCVVQYDLCDGSNLNIYACGPDGMPEVAETIICESGCLNGLCL